MTLLRHFSNQKVWYKTYLSTFANIKKEKERKRQKQNQNTFRNF